MPEATTEYRCVSQLSTQAKAVPPAMPRRVLECGFSRLGNKVSSDLTAMLSDPRYYGRF